MKLAFTCVYYNLYIPEFSVQHRKLIWQKTDFWNSEIKKKKKKKKKNDTSFELESLNEMTPPSVHI